MGRSSGLFTPSRRAWAGEGRENRGARARVAARATAARREASGGGGGGAAVLVAVAGLFEAEVDVVVAHLGDAGAAARCCVPHFDAALLQRR